MEAIVKGGGRVGKNGNRKWKPRGMFIRRHGHKETVVVAAVQTARQVNARMWYGKQTKRNEGTRKKVWGGVAAFSAYVTTVVQPE